MTADRKDTWRDLAASIADQISENIRNPRRAPSPGDDDPRESGDSGRTGYSRGFGYRDGHRYGASGHVGGRPRPARGWQPGRPPHRPVGGEMAAEFKDLVSASVKATTQSINERRAGRDERIRMRPVRRLRRRRARQIAAAGVLGLATFGAVGGAINAAGHDDAAAEIALGVVAAGLGTGSVVAGTRAAKTRRRADALEEKLSASSIDVPTYTQREETPESLPPKTSAAYQPIRRLRAQRRLLQQLLPDLKDVAPDISTVARDSEQSLERHAQRAVLLERTLAESGAIADETDDVGGIRYSLDKVVRRLEDGVAAHERLVAGAASVVAELDGATPGATAAAKAQDAADGLHALADGLREVSHPTGTPRGDRSSTAAADRADASLPPSYGPPRESRPRAKRNPATPAG